MRLFELFDTPGKWKWVGQSEGGGGADVFIGEYRYNVLIDENPFNHLERAASTLDNEVPDWLKKLADEDPTTFSIEFEFEDRQGILKRYGNKYGITGTGHQYKLFTTVMDIMKDFSQRYGVEWWTFTAHEPSRKKLYDRMVSKFGRKYFILDIGEERHYVVQA